MHSCLGSFVAAEHGSRRSSGTLHVSFENEERRGRRGSQVRNMRCWESCLDLPDLRLAEANPDPTLLWGALSWFASILPRRRPRSRWSTPRSGVSHFVLHQAGCKPLDRCRTSQEFVDGLGDKDRDMTDDFKEVADRGSRNTHTKEIKCSPMRSGRRFGVNFKLRDMGPFCPSLLGITKQLNVCGDNLLKIQCFSLAAGAQEALFHPLRGREAPVELRGEG